MPLYEYYCEPCNGVFELLRTPREAAKPQPCPECDDDAKRIVSKEWSAFIHRDGLPRRLPDTGGYWHLGKRVSKPLTGTIEGMQHPELKYKPKETAPSVEEIEQFEYRQEVKRELAQAQRSNVINQDVEKQDRWFRTRAAKTRGTDKEEKAKARLRQKESTEVRQKLRTMETEGPRKKK